MAFRQTLPSLRLTSSSKLFQWLSAAVLAVAPACLHAQTHYYTASHPLRLQGFANVVYAKPGFEQLGVTGTGTDYGFVGGGDLDVALHTWVIPSLDVRVSRVSGPVTSELVFAGGPRVVLPLGRFQPYGDFLIGAGKIYFNQSSDPNYRSDQSSVYTYGGGVDVPLTPGWGFRVDVQQERWRLTHNQPAFYAVQASVGVRYEIHGGKHSPQ